MKAVIRPHWSAQKKAAEMFVALKGLICRMQSHKFFDNFLRNCFLFLVQGKLIALKYAGQQLIY